MQQPNVWGIREMESAGPSCPIVPIHLPWHKRFFLTLFRFGVCPLCVTMSLGYQLRQRWRGQQR